MPVSGGKKQIARVPLIRGIHASHPAGGLKPVQYSYPAVLSLILSWERKKEQGQHEGFR